MKRLLSACLLAVSTLAVPAQNTGIGAYSFASFDNRGFDSVNLGNLNVRFSIPIINRQGRGLPFNYALQYEGLIWAPVTNSSTGATSWVNDPAWGFTGVLNGTAFSGYLTYTSGYYMCSDPDDPHPAHTAYDSNYIYHDRFGGLHPFNYMFRGYCPQTATEPSSPSVTTGDGSSSDGSGYRLINGSKVQALNGVIITPALSANGQDATNLTDTNGNQISKSTAGAFTDTLGQTALTVSGSSTVSFAYPVTLQSDNATTATATLSYRSYTVRTNFQCSNITESGSQTANLVDKLTLADGSFYQFTYEPTLSATDGAVTGRLASVTLPTGGTISYAYSGGCSSAGAGMNLDGSVGALTRTTSDGQRTYTRSPITNGSITTLTDEKNNQTQVSFVASAGSMYETHRQVYQGSAGGGSLMDRYSCYNGASASCDGQAINLPINEVDVTTSYNNGTQDLVKTQYVSQTTLPTSVAQYASASGTLLQTTTTSYNSIGEPLGITVTDGSNNTVSSSTFTYDGGSLTATSGIPQHVAASGTRRNLTSTQVSTGSGTLSTSATYYDTGAIQTSTAQDGGQTTYGYDSTQAFVTQTTLPTPSSGVSLSTSATYDAASTMPLTSTGMNSGETTSITGYDRLLRPTLATLPSGSSINYYYSSPNVTEVRQYLDSSGRHSDNFVQTDGYGRKIETAQYNGQASNSYYLVDYCYDATGLLKFQSTPYAWSGFNSTKTCSGSGTAYQYDALGRVTAVTTPDGTTNTTYTNRAVQTVDVMGITRIQQYDLLGRLSGVCEVSSNNVGNQSPAACGFDIAANGYLTSYAYNMASHTTTVTQGVQTRVFQTDAAGRTVSVTEPERGATSYSYTYNSVGLSVARTRPKQNQTSPSVTTTTTTQYDLLGRVASVGYNDGLTPSKNYYYDISVGSSQGWSATPTNVKGRLVNYTSGSGSTLARGMLGYDVSGDVTTLWQCAPSICGGSNQAIRPLQFGYDYGGVLTSESDVMSGAIVYGRSAAEEITSVTGSFSDANNPPNLVSSVTNTAVGATGYTLGNGLNVVNQFDTLGRRSGSWLCLNSSSTYCNSGTQRYGFTVAYKGNEAASFCDTGVRQCQNNIYDEFGRLTQVANTGGISGGAGSFTFTYDRWGNRLTQTALQNGPSTSFSYNNATNQATSLTYDAAGNMMNDGVAHTFQYDAEGNVLTVDSGSTATYVYDALNHRVSETTGSTTAEYVFDAMGRRVSTWNSTSPVEGRIYMDGTQLAFRGQNGHTFFETQNWLGTERLRTDATGAVAATEFSQAYGDFFQQGVNETNADQDNNQFAGLDHDAESGSEHAMFRQYSSTQGRWQSPDPYDGSYDARNPQSLNRYTYAENNPFSVVDPLGLEPCSAPERGYFRTGVHAQDDGGDGAGGGDCDGSAGSVGLYTLTLTAVYHPISGTWYTLAPPIPGLPSPVPPPSGGLLTVTAGPTGGSGNSSGSANAGQNNTTGNGQNNTNKPKSPARQQCEQNALNNYQIAMARANQDGLRNWGRDTILSTTGGLVGGCVAGGMISGGPGCPVGGIVGTLGGFVSGATTGLIDAGLTAYWGRQRAAEDFGTAMQQCAQIP